MSSEVKIKILVKSDLLFSVIRNQPARFMKLPIKFEPIEKGNDADNDQHELDDG